MGLQDAPGRGAVEQVLQRRGQGEDTGCLPGVSDKGPGPSGLQKRISTKTESSEASKVFTKRKKSTVHVHRQGEDSEGESLSCALLAVCVTYMGHFFQFSFGQ